MEEMKHNFKDPLDIRELYKTGDFFICDDALELINQMIQKGKSSRNVLAGLRFINELARAGIFQVLMWAHDSEILKYLVKSVDEIQNSNKKLERGADFLP